nr:uncharacterized protein LOC113819888 [Penaeus vannamei]
MELKVAPVALVALATVTSIAVLPRGAEAISKWVPAPPRRKLNVPGCVTPRGILELGQRVYLPGCRRLVCKSFAGQPFVEDQTCDSLPGSVPLHCTVRHRRHRRYPDCCPEVTCPPIDPSPHTPPGRTPWGGMQVPYPEETFVGVGGRYPGGVQLPTHYADTRPRVTPRPFTFMDGPEVILGSGFSDPWQPQGDHRGEVLLRERPVEVSQEIDAFGTVGLDSPSNALGGWRGTGSKGGDYDYAEDDLTGADGGGDAYYDSYDSYDFYPATEDYLSSSATPRPWDASTRYEPPPTTAPPPPPTARTRWTSPYIPPTTSRPHERRTTSQPPITTTSSQPRTWGTTSSQPRTWGTTTNQPRTWGTTTNQPRTWGRTNQRAPGGRPPTSRAHGGRPRRSSSPSRARRPRRARLPSPTPPATPR